MSREKKKGKTPFDPNRRVVLRRLGQAGLVLGAAGAAAGFGLRSPGRWGHEEPPPGLPDRRVAPVPGLPPMAVAKGGAIAALVRAAVGAVGGIERFVRKGDRVLVKPNMAWDRPPELGANTHPDVIGEVVRLCREAGASRVLIVEHPVHHPERTAARSGVGEAARNAGADVLVPPNVGFVKTALGGSVLGSWDVLAPALEVDRIINVPVVKVHSLSGLTCGLKNWYGLLGGAREVLHQWIHPSIADLGAAFLPTLTVTDATRVLIRGGPTGGRPSDVVPVGAVAAGTDPVALDAWAAGLVGLDPREIGHVTLAEGRGLGFIDAGTGPIEEIHAGA